MRRTKAPPQSCCTLLRPIITLRRPQMDHAIAGTPTTKTVLYSALELSKNTWLLWPMLDRGQSLSLWGFWCNAIQLLHPSILASEHLHVVRHHRGRHNGARGHDGRDQHRARAQSEAHAPSASSLIGSQLCGRRWCCWSQVLCASTAGWSWSETASRLPSAARRCRPSSCCISNRNPTPSPNTSWGIPCQADGVD